MPLADTSTAPTEAPHSTLVFRHEAFSGHDTGRSHPENPARLTAIDHELRSRGLMKNRPSPSWEPATDGQILRVHTPALLDHLEILAAQGGGAVDPDTILLPDSLTAARLAAGAGIAAVNHIASGDASTALVLGRPPGHHATRDRAMGFCLLNTVAIAAAHALESGLSRVAILDWDVHHGNGTQDIFVASNNILFCSTHRFDGWFFPATGAADEQGVGAGRGYTINVPLRPGDGDDEILGAFTSRILPAIADFGPDLLLISAGYDAHREDPLGGLRVTDGGFRTLARTAFHAAREHAHGRVIAVLEGGYHPLASARCVADLLEELDALSI